jgi:uncharacterized protein (DUF2225 family)
MKMPEEQKITFFERKNTVCPICGAKFYREELLSGGGRLLAGKLTDELRRYYDPSKKFGEVYPLIYPITVCPVCYFSAYHVDFPNVRPERIRQAEIATDERRDSISLIFRELDFTSPRALREGAASYCFAISCYGFFGREANPIFKSGLSSLRAAWLFDDLHAHNPGENFDALSRIFYGKARLFYKYTLEQEQKGKEPLAGNINFGPDLDKNYGYDGLIYLAAYLDYKYGEEGDAQKRIDSLESSKRMIAKVFGMGKSSKSKPSSLLDLAKRIYNDIGKEIANLKGEEPPAEVEGDFVS